MVFVTETLCLLPEVGVGNIIVIYMIHSLSKLQSQSEYCGV
jgi:hypothetical protein